MATLHDNLEQGKLWDDLMAELHELDEKVNYAVTLHEIMNQRSHLDTPVQYERLFLYSRGGKEEQKMNIQQAIDKATEGGYHINGSDGMGTDYSGASSEYSAWTRKDNQSSFMVAVEETFLDPQFWQALGRALGWNQGLTTVHAVENGRPAIVSRGGQHWLYHWHRFLDCLAAGKTADDFFKSLPEKE